MAVEDLMTQALTFLRQSSATRDAIGGSAPAVEAELVVDGYLEPVSGTEDMVDRNTQVGDWWAAVPASADVDGWDRMTHDGRTFDVIAPPRPIYNPRTQAVSHQELDLREVV